MRFLGMVGYYRKYCRNFAGVVEPLVQLLWKKQTFNWTEGQQAAFDDSLLHQYLPCLILISHLLSMLTLVTWV